MRRGLEFLQQPLFNKPGSSGSDPSSELANNGAAVTEELMNDRFQKKRTSFCLLLNLFLLHEDYKLDAVKN
ncbi:hypothetical protein FHT22_001072 [Pedobacter sp. SG918]|nr:hypothetical protein [Pedobacter sp. SG918]